MNQINLRTLAAELKAGGVYIPYNISKDQVKLAKFFGVTKDASYAPRGLGFRVTITEAKAEKLRKKYLTPPDTPVAPEPVQTELWDDTPLDAGGEPLHTQTDTLALDVAEIKVMLSRIMAELGIK